MKLCIGVSCTTSLATLSGGLHYNFFASITAFLFFFRGPPPGPRKHATATYHVKGILQHKLMSLVKMHIRLLLPHQLYL